MILSVESEMDTMEVPDPYYGGERGFEEVFILLDRACEQIAKSLDNE